MVSMSKSTFSAFERKNCLNVLFLELGLNVEADVLF